jgi:hypothetical protein
MKTSMVTEAIQHGRAFFYEETERHELRTQRALPPWTRVWLGRYSGSGVGLYGTDIGINIGESADAGHGLITTTIVGPLAIQVFTAHVPSQYNDSNINLPIKLGPWDQLLVTIWPSNRLAAWPPPLTFNNSGDLPIAALMGRWRTGVRT